MYHLQMFVFTLMEKILHDSNILELRFAYQEDSIITSSIEPLVNGQMLH